MNISELSLKRPVLATVMNLMLLMFGIVGFIELGVREYPAIDPPVISVQTSYTGANAEVIESQITEPLEKAVNGIPGVRTISSTSSTGRSRISVEFNLDVDLETAANDVRDKVSQAVRSLPADIDAAPVVSKADANSEFIILVAIQSNTKSLLELSDYAENVLQDKFQTIPQVSSVNIHGQKRPAMRIWLQPDKMKAFNVAYNDITAIMQKENVESPTGKIDGTTTELTIKTSGRFTTEDDFRNMILKNSPEGLVTLGDVAKVEIGPERYEQSWKLNGLFGVGLSVVPQPGANYIEIADEFYKRLEEIKASEKGDIQFTTLIDSTKNVRRSLTEVKETLLIAILLVILIIFLFFRDWLIALRPLIDIPVSLIATFFVLYLMGYSINILSLLGIVLATGLVVDDGIVVTENIFRKFEKGLPIKRAALEGSKEIFFAVISTSLTLAIVFLPIFFMQGFVGSLFREFGIVVAVAVLISSFVSLTITPVLNVVLNAKKRGHSTFYKKTEPFYEGLEQGYKTLITKFIHNRIYAWGIVAACAVLIVLLGIFIQSELAPLEDKSQIRMQISAPEGVSYNYMITEGEKLTNFLIDSIPEREFSFLAIPGFSSTGVNSGMGRIGLVSADLRDKTQTQIAKELQRKFAQFNTIRVIPVEEQTIAVGLGSKGSMPVQFVIQNFDFEKLKEGVTEVMEQAKANQIFQNVDVNLKFNKPEVAITIDRLKARELGLTISDIAEVLQSAFSGRRIAYFTMEGKQYQVLSQVELANRQDPSDILALQVRNNQGEYISLSSVLQVITTANPPTLYHHNRMKSATISASLAEGKTIGDGVTAMQTIANNVLDESFQTSLSGPSRDYAESSSNTLFAFLLALLLVYLILAAQFESFKDPLIIMISVPLAMAGGLLSLWLFGQTLNIFSQIGMITLIGLVTKNGILIVEFANQKREQGLAKFEAVIEASTLRLRPILMTSFATILGALPIALSLGSAGTSRMSLGIVIVGGLLFSLILTLFVIPAIYTYISGHVSKKESIV
ncbi:MAG: Efflux pump membrane transporter BepE [Bacteroidetes bacterium ADurb.Bin217]|nr:MAG: Efflux pump membrane transporter BepE [Bacteroidetes bacterium ADurb.Bin217]